MSSNTKLKRGVSIITLGVKSLSDSINFYKNMGWELSPTSDPKMCTFIVTPNMTIGLVEYCFLAKDIGIDCDAKQRYSGFTLAINGESTNEVDDIFDRAIQSGAKIHETPRWKDWGGYEGYSGYIEDLDGYFWEIAYAPFSGLSNDGTLQP